MQTLTGDPMQLVDIPLWQRCEQRFNAWLCANGYRVIALCEASGNTRGKQAPMMTVCGRERRCPDFQSSKSGKTEYWEVKYRSRPHMDPVQGRAEHRVGYRKFEDYEAISKHEGVPVWLVVYEERTGTNLARWLCISVEEARRSGRLAKCPTASDTEEDTWLWPMDAMSVLQVPAIDSGGVEPPLVSDDEPDSPLVLSDYERHESELRSFSRSGAPGVVAAKPPAENSALDVGRRRTLKLDRWAGLEVLRRSLGIKTLPRYSVTRIGTKDLDLRQLLGLLEYGIRVFLLSETDLPKDVRTACQAFLDTRLLEFECVPDAGKVQEWFVDGIPANIPPKVRSALNQADEKGGFNFNQYKIVHADPACDALVTAGAGTGKTETMSERLVFLLATGSGTSETSAAASESTSRPVSLSLDQVALVTFTREAASEMRRRIAQTFMLRQRLCCRCVHPVSVWMMDLGRTQISTIHMFARQMLRRFGATIGFGPGFKVSAKALDLRQWVTDSLSPRFLAIADRLSEEDQQKLPAFHEWVTHVETIWEALENNGVHVVKFGREIPEEIDWGWDEPRSNLVRDVIKDVGARLGTESVKDQFLRTSQLVPAAHAALRIARQSGQGLIGRPLRFLFVDEFQDTDAMQLSLLLEVRQALDGRLFVVGDMKQGIYRFRGAAGDAFQALRAEVQRRGLPKFNELGLVRNFRTDGNLLADMHRHFAALGEAKLLPYQECHRLLPHRGVENRGDHIEFHFLNGGDLEGSINLAADLAVRWRTQSKDARIAILCRRNTQALKVQKAIKARDRRCELLVGGQFFITEAVLELRAFLDAVVAPDDPSALLELCETRWAPAILEGTPGVGIGGGSPSPAWDGTPVAPDGWLRRLTYLGGESDVVGMDLRVLSHRVRSLQDMLRRMSAMAFIAECGRILVPYLVERSGEESLSRSKYGRNLAHLITLMDAQFAMSSVTIDSLLAWLRLQIAVNRNEDEPAEDSDFDASTVAITVHKSKGLEFDYVIIPYTATSFEPPRFVKTRVFVAERDRSRMLRWIWTPTDLPSLRNQCPDAVEWQTDQLEVDREEARLLYVGMTRAKRRLAIVRARNPKEQTWGHLLARGDRS